MLTRNGPVVADDHNRASTRQGDSADADDITRRLADSEAKLSEWYGDLKYCVDHFHLLNDWECDFVLGVAGYKRPSTRQRDKLGLILRKIELALTARSRRART
jgi:hypothetical protein